ncbi:MAG: inverse autotransporter beta domain-containing protein [Sulfuricella sp.]|nr:inverse autotransporter beta domain-containing protein [Sulfuricella sp.]
MKKNKPLGTPNCTFQPKAIVVAVAMALSAPGHADWTPTVEAFIKPGSNRTLGGVDALLPLRQDEQSLVFADIKGHGDNKNGNEFNLGLGYRSLTNDGKWALGAYAAWDHRRSELGNDFNQVTVGAEARGEQFDLRANAYIPTTDKKLTGLGAANHFAGFGVWRNGVFEEAMRGFDVEAGTLLPISSTVETRLYLAGYSFKGEDVAPTTNGYRVRMEARFNQNMTIGVSTQHDGVFGTANFLEARYTFGKEPKQAIRTVKERMNEPWTRDIDVVVSHPTESTNAAFSQLTVDRAVHINSSAAEGGDGSYENPYNSVSSCESAKCSANTSGIGDYSLIRMWQGTSATGEPYSRVTLQDGQTLWGQGIDIYTGRVQADLYPVINANGGTGVTLASNGTLGNTVKGVSISGEGRGIVGNNTWGTVNLTGNIINVSNNGIGLYNTVHDGSSRSQAVNIANNTITSANTAIRSYNNVGGEGSASAVTQTIDISNNNITASAGIRLGNYAYLNGTATQTVTISGNTIDGNWGGIYAENEAWGGASAVVTQNLTISNNLVNAVEGEGIGAWNWAAEGASATQNLTISDNTINNAYGNGISLGNGAWEDGSTAVQTAAITGNTITAGNMGIVAYNYAEAKYASNTATQSLTISGNTVAATTGIGLYNRAWAYNYGAETATQTATISGNTLTAAEGESWSDIDAGIGIVNFDNGQHDAVQTVTVSGSNTISGFRYGVGAYRVTSHPSSSQTVNVSGVTATGLPEAANAIVTCGSGVQTMTVGSGNTGNGTAVTTTGACNIDD